MTQEDLAKYRVAANAALAKVIAYKQVGKLAEAKAWRAELNRLTTEIVEL